MRTNLLKQQAFAASIRSFFGDREIIEVSTACLLPTTVPDPNIGSVRTHGQASSGYLQTSPEFAMKSLLAQGSGDIFQIAHAFRDDAKTQWHRGEFLMLEWYRLGWDETQLLEEVKELFQQIVPSQWRVVSVLDWLTMQGWSSSRPEHWKELAARLGLHGEDHHPLDLLDFLVQTCVYDHGHEHNQWIVYTDFPAEIPGYACCANGVQQRFEVYFGPLEIANGCREETNPELLKKRLERQQAHAQAKGDDPIEIDESFLRNVSCLEHVSGVAVGLDRLFSLKEQSAELCSLVQL